MGFYYAREKQKFDAEWERLSAWYQAEGMSAEAIEAIRQFDWANFCHQRVYEHWTTAFPEDTYVEDSKVCTLLRCCASMAETDEVSQMLRGRYDWIEQIDDPVLAERLKHLTEDDLELLTRYVFEDATQKELASQYVIGQQSVSKRLKKLKSFLTKRA